METITISKEKEFTAVEFPQGWLGVYNSESQIMITTDPCEKALMAINDARRIKKELKGAATKTKPKKKKVVEKKQTSIIKRKVKLYTEEEMSARTDLSFKEIWVILSKEEKFVSTSLKNKQLATYTDNKDDAEIYNTYEDASIRIKTLNSCVACGHKARRYFVESED